MHVWECVCECEWVFGERGGCRLTTQDQITWHFTLAKCSKPIVEDRGGMWDTGNREALVISGHNSGKFSLALALWHLGLLWGSFGLGFLKRLCTASGAIWKKDALCT